MGNKDVNIKTDEAQFDDGAASPQSTVFFLDNEAHIFRFLFSRTDKIGINFSIQSSPRFSFCLFDSNA